MSDLLQQAIIDAMALKEAAIKNAENTLIEKYSEEFNETVKKLLEQEEIAAPATAAPTPDAGAAASLSPDASQAASGADADQSNKRDAFNNVKTAFLDGPEDELITINFDQLKSTMMEMLGYEEELEEEYDRTGTRTEDVSKDSLKAGAKKEESLKEEEISEESVEEESMDEGASYSEDEAIESLQEMEVQLDEYEDPAMAGSQELSDAAKLKKQAAEKESQAASKKNAASAEKAKAEAEKGSAAVQTEDIELTEEELITLEEDYRVDLDPQHQNRGYMGSTNSERELLRQLEMAAARDEHNTKQREEEKKKMQDLVKENVKLKDLNDKMLSALETLKEQAEKINVSNAKLLYTNKALVNISLNERQKNQIVESISKADSVLAAKTIYETIQNAVEGAQTKSEAPQSLRETLNRASTPFVVKKSSANNLTDVMSERMKILAGIKKQ